LAASSAGFAGAILVWGEAGRSTPPRPMKIYNTMTRSKEELVPLVPGEIRMYS
jgi:hypothetical protein